MASFPFTGLLYLPFFLYIFGILFFFLAAPRAINCLISFPVNDALYNLFIVNVVRGELL